MGCGEDSGVIYQSAAKLDPAATYKVVQNAGNIKTLRQPAC
jgi:hypothetical protein